MYGNYFCGMAEGALTATMDIMYGIGAIFSISILVAIIYFVIKKEQQDV